MSRNEKYLPVNNNNSTISNNNSVLTYLFPMTFKPNNDEIGLLNCFMYYSWFNVTSNFNNNKLVYVVDGISKTITYPDGYYNVSDLNGFLKLQMFQNGDYLLDDSGSPVYYIDFVSNSVYYCITLTCSPLPSSLPTGWSNPNNITLTGETMQLYFLPNNNFHKLLGFQQNAYYPPAPQTGIYQVNSGTPQLSPVYLINIQTNMGSLTSVFNSVTSTIYQFSPANTSFGGQIKLEPFNIIYLPIDNSIYNKLEVSFTDQDNNPLHINDVDISLTFCIRKRN